jgi:hypothetical protein
VDAEWTRSRCPFAFRISGADAGAHLAASGTRDSAFDERTAASGRFNNRLGIDSAMTFRRPFGPWLTSFQEQAESAGVVSALRTEERK